MIRQTIKIALIANWKFNSISISQIINIGPSWVERKCWCYFAIIETGNRCELCGGKHAKLVEFYFYAFGFDGFLSGVDIFDKESCIIFAWIKCTLNWWFWVWCFEEIESLYKRLLMSFQFRSLYSIRKCFLNILTLMMAVKTETDLDSKSALIYGLKLILSLSIDNIEIKHKQIYWFFILEECVDWFISQRISCNDYKTFYILTTSFFYSIFSSHYSSYLFVLFVFFYYFINFCL